MRLARSVFLDLSPQSLPFALKGPEIGDIHTQDDILSFQVTRKKTYHMCATTKSYHLNDGAVAVHALFVKAKML